MKGNITAESEEGVGSTFMISFPAKAEKHVSMRSTSFGSIIEGIPNLQEPILLIEDNLAKSI